MNTELNSMDSADSLSRKAPVLWSGHDIADALCDCLQTKRVSRSSGDTIKAYGVSIDTRTLEQGDLFIAIIGPNQNGHDYVINALDKGAAAVIISEDVNGLDMEDTRVFYVQDTQKALEALGQFSRQASQAHLVGVTGSVGKTTVKEMLGCAFGALGRTHWSQASYNNHWGVPLSLSLMPKTTTDFGVFEMGMNHEGEIAPLAKQVRPHVAIVTTVAAVHIENFNSVVDIAVEKAQIFSALEGSKVAILPRDNEYFDILKETAQGYGVESILTFGEHENADARMISCLVASNGSRCQANILGEDITFTLSLPGRHHALNALSVLLAVAASGQDVQKAAQALAQFYAVDGRGATSKIKTADPENPVTLIDESYNASPVAMKAAFKVMAMIDPGRGGRRIAVLGDMLELGNQAQKRHAELALPLQSAGVDLVYTCGSMMQHLHNNLAQDMRGSHKENSEQLAQIVPDVLVPGDVVLVKGSLGSRMKVVVEALRSLPEDYIHDKSNAD